ncbi:hypothetical protein NYE44_14055 [Paenibacillus sp. FSL L8-0493]|uniref:hypothetical protein n=1 Tax=unclassified Paenibacillus TaxID=185978 RepID=UPI0030FC2EDF
MKLKGKFSFGIMVTLTTSLVLGNLVWSNPTAQEQIFLAMILRMEMPTIGRVQQELGL